MTAFADEVCSQHGPIQPPRLDFGALGRGPIENILELKLSYDFAG